MPLVPWPHVTTGYPPVGVARSGTTTSPVTGTGLSVTDSDRYMTRYATPCRPVTDRRSDLSRVPAPLWGNGWGTEKNDGSPSGAGMGASVVAVGLDDPHAASATASAATANVMRTG